MYDAIPRVKFGEEKIKADGPRGRRNVTIWPVIGVPMGPRREGSAVNFVRRLKPSGHVRLRVVYRFYIKKYLKKKIIFGPP